MQNRSSSKSVAAPFRVIVQVLALMALLLPGLARAQIETEADLRAALAEGGDILFDSDVQIVLTAPIVISESVTIDAAGNEVTISGEDQAQLFFIEDGVEDVNFVGISFINGTGEKGGAVHVSPNAVVTFSECSFRHNKAAGVNGTDGNEGADEPDGIGCDGGSGTAGKPAWGGAIYSEGTVTLSTCEFLTNSATGGLGGEGGAGGNGLFQGGNGGNGGNGAAAYGGAVFNSGTLTATDCEFDGNFTIGGDGGTGGEPGDGAFLARPGIGGGGAPTAGAAVYSPGELSLARCTFYGNGAWGGNSTAGGTQQNGNGSDGRKGGNAAGGAVWSAAEIEGSIENCTFNGNVVRGGDGGNGGPGSFTAGDGGNGGDAIGAALCNSNMLFVWNCTFALNAAYGGTNGVAGSGAFGGSNGKKGAARGAGIANSAGVLTIKGTLLSTNAPGTNVARIAGTIEDEGYNYSSDKATALTAATSSNNVTTRLGNLGANGGFTKTMALVSTSPALDKMPPEEAPETDQRGVARPIGARSDIGAFEFDPTGAPVMSVGPSDQILPQSSTATFSVKADGGRPLSYQWSLNGADIPGATASTLTLTNIQPAQSGTYAVTVENASGTNAASATLNLAPLIVWGEGLVTNVPLSATNLVWVSAGGYHMLALRQDGLVLGWGAGTSNLNVEPHFGQATVPANLGNTVAIAAGGFHSLALRSDGRVAAWGRSTFGQTSVPAGATNVLTIAAGENHSLASSSTDGSVSAWGLNSGGQTNVPAGLTNVVGLAAGAHHSVALKNDGTVVVWGTNNLGQGTIPAGLGSVFMIAAGANHTLALRTNGTVVAWGDNSLGQSSVPSSLTNVVFIAAGGNHSIAVRNNGAIVAWGDRPLGQSAVTQTLSAIVADGGQRFSAALVQAQPPAVPFENSPVSAFSITTSRSGATNLVEVLTLPGVIYEIQQRSDLSPAGQWTSVGTNSGTGARLSFPVPSGPLTNSFYRVLAR